MIYTTHITPEEYRIAYSLAADRRLVMRGSRDAQSGRIKTNLDSEIMSVAAELIVARLTGAYPTALAGYDHDAADLANGIEVRATSHADGHLILRPKDKDRADRLFVLVTYRDTYGKTTQFRVHGGIKGHDAMSEDYWTPLFGNGGDPAWMIPQSALTDLRLLFPRGHQ